MDYTSLFTTMSDNVTSGLTTIVPIALVVGGSVLAISLGWKLFKRFIK